MDPDPKATTPDSAGSSIRGPARSIVIYAGALALAISLLFPPWVYTFQTPGMGQVRVPAGYALLFAPPLPRYDNGRDGVELDAWRLLVQTGLILVVGAVAWWSCDPVSSRVNARRGM